MNTSATQVQQPLRVGRVALHFRKDRLPPARSFYEVELGKVGRPNRKGWAQARCPFHSSKSGLSFSVNLDSGGFYCFSCDAKGGDVIAFIRLRDGVTFKEACARLGCWDEDGKPAKVRPGLLIRNLVMDFVVDGIEYRASIPDEPRTELQWLRRFHVASHDRLIEIRNGADAGDGEEEPQWGILASSWELIQIEVDANGGE
jgi:CHC2 zinc finger